MAKWQVLRLCFPSFPGPEDDYEGSWQYQQAVSRHNDAWRQYAQGVINGDQRVTVTYDGSSVHLYGPPKAQADLVKLLQQAGLRSVDEDEPHVQTALE